MKKLSLILLVLLGLISCKVQYNPELSLEELQAHLSYMATDELKGRYPGTPEDALLLNYITSELEAAGLELYQGNGIQNFSLVTSLEYGPGNDFRAGGQPLTLNEEFTPLSFSASASASGSFVFAGYGFSIADGETAWDDYAGVDVKGRWVVILRGVPGKQEASSPYMNYSEDRGKALLAADKGAAGVILVSGYSYAKADKLEELKGKEHSLSIPVIQLKRSAIEKGFAQAGLDSLAQMERKMIAELKPASFALDAIVEVSVDLQPQEVETGNVVAILEGSDAVLKAEYVVIGGHHDHLGMGGPGTSSRRPDTTAVHYGADDNASGVAGVMELAEVMAANQPARSMLFTTFGAEELGLVGSKYLTGNPPIDLDAVQAMINLDMVARLSEDRTLQIGGVGTSPGFKALLDTINVKYKFNVKYGNEGYGPSDHASFYAKDVPVLFISTGAHADYHTPADDFESVNWEGMQEVLEFTAEVARQLASQKERIAFTEAGPKVKGSTRGHRGGITLGLMPDVTYDGSDGMPVMFVTEAKPAALGGIQKGDVITAIDGKTVGNVYDYMSRLGNLKEGQAVVVSVIRKEEPLEILIRIF